MQNQNKVMRKLRRREVVLLCGACIVLASGCDPVRTASQTLRLQVVDSASGEPVIGIRVQVKQDFELFQTDDAQLQKSDEWEQHQREFWEGLPWHFAITDEDGIADIDIIETALDRSRGDEPPASRNMLFGRTYLVVMGDDNEHADEALRLKIEEDARLTEGNITLTVLDVAEPKYVE
jgi:hypothetical protein